MSIIGKKYIPYDNSYCVNLTSTSGYPYKNDTAAYLAGTQVGDAPKECIIVSEPFLCTVPIMHGDTKEIEMVLVNYNGCTYSIMFHKDAIVNNEY